jgi:hypothetical protein
VEAEPLDEPELMPVPEELEPMLEDEPELLPVPEVPHALSAKAHVKGMIHFIIKILLKKNRNILANHEMLLMPKLHACE